MKELTDFQKKFFARGTGATLFTQEEFDEALALARAEICLLYTSDAADE